MFVFDQTLVEQRYCDEGLFIADGSNTQVVVVPCDR